jgi:hypothetical protein
MQAQSEPSMQPGAAPSLTRSSSTSTPHHRADEAGEAARERSGGDHGDHGDHHPAALSVTSGAEPARRSTEELAALMGRRKLDRAARAARREDQARKSAELASPFGAGPTRTAVRRASSRLGGGGGGGDQQSEAGAGAHIGTHAVPGGGRSAGVEPASQAAASASGSPTAVPSAPQGTATKEGAINAKPARKRRESSSVVRSAVPRRERSPAETLIAQHYPNLALILCA